MGNIIFYISHTGQVIPCCARAQLTFPEFFWDRALSHFGFQDYCTLPFCCIIVTRSCCIFVLSLQSSTYMWYSNCARAQHQCHAGAQNKVLTPPKQNWTLGVSRAWALKGLPSVSAPLLFFIFLTLFSSSVTSISSHSCVSLLFHLSLPNCLSLLAFQLFFHVVKLFLFSFFLMWFLVSIWLPVCWILWNC